MLDKEDSSWIHSKGIICVLTASIFQYPLCPRSFTHNSVLPSAQAETLASTLIPFCFALHIHLSATPVVSVFKIYPEPGCVLVHSHHHLPGGLVQSPPNCSACFSPFSRPCFFFYRASRKSPVKGQIMQLLCSKHSSVFHLTQGKSQCHCQSL